jgi:hypothetical protein
MEEMSDGSKVAGLNVVLFDAPAGVGADLLPRRRFPMELNVDTFVEGVSADAHSRERSNRRWRVARLAMVKVDVASLFWLMC